MTTKPIATVVELWAARIPGLGRFADHHWFVVRRPTAVDRWEVWQSKNAGRESWGHLHRNLKEPTCGVGNGPGRMLMQWLGEDACALAERIESSPRDYPWCSRYWVWPGPNSNTFVQWVLEDTFTLSWRGFGGRYCRRRAKRSPSDS
jgi:hypothetical protein